MANDIANAHSSSTTIKHGTAVVFQHASSGNLASGVALNNTISAGSHASEISALPASGDLFNKYDARFDDKTYYTT